MSSIVNGSSRTAQSTIAIGVLIVAATSVFIIQTRRRRRRRNNDNNNDDGGKSNDPAATDDDETNFYKQLGISEENLPTHIQREIQKERKRKAKVEIISMKTRMYDNVYMLDTNREPMCTISMKKARWYIKKGIGEWSTFKETPGDSNNTSNFDNGEEELKCIRLLFEHNGSTKANPKSADEMTNENLYLRSAKQNICVVCGNDGYHIRHYIVPYTYRTLLPEQYRTHMSHDIVIMCPDCHLLCEKPKKARMKKMEEELRMQMGEAALDMSPVIDDPHLHHIRSCAIALVKWKDQMPKEKVESHDRTVREYLASVCRNEEGKAALLSGEEGLTKAQLQKACSVNYRVKNPNFMEGSEVVVKSLKDAKDTEKFIVGWREHFVATVDPQHMPTGWRVDNPVVCGSRKDGDAYDGVKTW